MAGPLVVQLLLIAGPFGSLSLDLVAPVFYILFCPREGASGNQEHTGTAFYYEVLGDSSCAMSAHADIPVLLLALH